MRYRFEDIAVNSTKKKQPTDADREVYIGLEHIDSEDFQVHRWGSDVTPAGEKLIMSKGDVLFGKRRAYQRKVAIAPFDGIFSAHGMVLRPKTDVICTEFFPFFIASDQFMETAIRISVGGLSPTINWKDLKVQEFELPPLEKQKRLALQLQAAYRLKEAYKRLLVATDEMVKSQFTEMFGSKGSDNRIGDVFLLKAGNYIKAECIQPHSSERYCYPCFGGNGIRGYVSLYSNEGPNPIIGRQGALCGNVTLADGKYYATEHALVVSPKVDYNVIWACFALSMMNLNRYARGVAQPGLSLNQLNDLKISVPPLSLQNQFAEIVRQADKSKFELKRAIEAIDQVIKSLING